jgi:aspartate aminotransferase-like enzyme
MSDRANIYPKQYLVTGGPTPLPPRVSQVMAEPILYHRAPAFVEIYSRVLVGLRAVFQTQNEVLCFAASGTGAMESAVANLVAHGEPALVASSGKFGERWAELCDAYGADLTHLDVEWGERVEAAALERAIGGMAAAPRAVFVTHSETSTGVVNDVRALNDVAKAAGAVLCVDAISSLGCVDLPQDEWGIDVVVAGSQKSLMCPPGLAFTSASERAMELAAEAPGRRYYYDWQLTLKGQDQDPPNSAFTPAVTLFRGLDVALEMIFAEGLEHVFARHAILARGARAGIEALGIERFGPDDDDANVVTVARIPDEIDGGKVQKLMRDRYGVTALGGQGDLKGKIVRIAHCGYFGAFDILIAIGALELALRDAGFDAEPGAGTAAVQRAFAEAGIAPEPVS